MGFEVVRTILAGVTLVAEAIQSQNYVAGSAGWHIGADGSAEFNNVTVRGTFEIDGVLNSYIKGVTDGSGNPTISLYGGLYPDNHALTPPDPALIETTKVSVVGNHYTQLSLIGPSYAGGDQGQLLIASATAENPFGASAMTLTAGEMLLTAVDLTLSSTNGITLQDTVNLGSTPAVTVTLASTNFTNGTTTSTSFTNTLTTTGIHGVAFVAPPSGEVTVIGRTIASNSTAGSFAIMDFEVRTGSTVGSGTVVRASDNFEAGLIQSSTAGNQGTVVTTGLVSGLTPGNTYNAALTYLIGTSGTASYNRRHIIVSPVVA